MIVLQTFDTHYLLRFEYKSTKNLITEDFLNSFIEKLELIKKNNGPKIIFITGYDNVFCLGVDFQKIKLESKNPKFLKEIKNYFIKAQKILSFLMTSDFISVALVNGHAIGLGFELVMACDMSVSFKNAYLSLPQLHYGVHPDYLNVICEYKKLNKNIINRLLYLNEKLDPQRAVELGLMTEMIEGDFNSHFSGFVKNKELQEAILRDKKLSFIPYINLEKKMMKQTRRMQLKGFIRNYT